MLAVVAVAVLVTGAITIPLTRSSTVSDGRDRLVAQVDLLASLDRLPVRLASESTAALSGARYAVVAAPPSGTANGAAASYLTEPVRKALRSGGSYSGELNGTYGRALVEARATSSGAWLVAALPVTELDSAVGKATRRVLLGLVLGLAVAALASMALAQWLTRPLRETAKAARRLAAGERGVALPGAGSTEGAELSSALESLDRALATSEGRQREFLLSISHEMRTPLAAVRGYAEALADGMIAPSELSEVGGTLVRETERLDAFVRDLLELARLQADDFTIQRVPVDLDALLSHVRTAWSAKAATLQVALTVAGSAPGAALADPQRLRQVVDGLVENALRATPAGGTVTVTVRPDAGALVVEVADTGPGLQPDDLAVAFERGALHAKYRDNRPVGTGLGLSIAARLITRMGGTLRAGNGAEGAAFTVTLPTMPQSAA
jgi:two-component system sensor histidine kinase BaeS